MTKPLNTLKIDDKVHVLSGYNGKRVGEGTVISVAKNWVTVYTPLFARPVRFRTNPDKPLCGIRIIGGLAEYMNERIIAAE